MPQYLDKTGLTTLWTKIKKTFALKSHTHKKSEITDLTIPTVNNPTITINQGGTKKGSFTLNQSGAATIDLTDNNTTYSTATQSSNGLMSASDKKKLDGIVGTSFVSGNSSNGEHNANNAITNGHYYYSSNGPATSLGASYTDGALYVQSHSDAWVGQIAQDYRNGSLFVRGKNNGSWSSWKSIIDSGNIGSQNVKYADTAGSAKASDVYSWAKASTKPTYTKSEVGLGNVDNTADANKNVNYATSAGNADTLDGNHASAFARIAADNNLMYHTDEFTFASSGFSGAVWLNYRTAGGTNGNITEYKLGNGAGGLLGSIIHSGNIGSQNVNYANSAGSANSVAWGNVSGRPSSLPASDVYAWAKASSKPSYSWSEITSKPNILPYTPLNGGLTTVTSTSTWGNQTGSETASFADNAGGGLKFRKNCPSNGKMSMIIDGTVYVNEGANKVIDTSNISMSLSNGVLTITYNV